MWVESTHYSANRYQKRDADLQHRPATRFPQHVSLPELSLHHLYSLSDFLFLSRHLWLAGHESVRASTPSMPTPGAVLWKHNQILPSSASTENNFSNKNQDTLLLDAWYLPEAVTAFEKEVEWIIKRDAGERYRIQRSTEGPGFEQLEE